MTRNTNKYSVVLDGVTRTIGDKTILKNIDIELEEAMFYTLLGPSGCGKTSILNIIAGFDEPTSGRVLLEGKDVGSLPANKRRINTVFQNYSLFPHLNVYDNVAFGPSIRGVDKKTIDQEIKNALALVKLEGFASRRIDELSGGQQQRVAIARAIVNKPKVLLLDEPFSALDMKLRKTMQVDLKRLQRNLGITFVFVTHDQEEALAMSDWIFVMNEGEIIQSGPHTDIYDEPINKFVAEFIGDSNIVDGLMKDDYLVEFLGREMECSDAGIARNERIQVVVRPEDIGIVEPGQGEFDARVTAVLFRGVFNEILALDETGYSWKIHTTLRIEKGDKLGLRIGPEEIHVMRFGENEDDFDKRIEMYSGGSHG